MNFTSFQYAGFLGLVVLVYWISPTRWRPAVLVAASYVFYLTWSVPATGVLALVTLMAWIGGIVISRRDGSGRRMLTAISTIAVLGGLLTFKLLRTVSPATAASGPSGRVLVPAGLSFFSLHAVSYLIDVHRGEVEASRSPIDVAAYVSFFPHLLAGPVLRARSFIPSIHTSRRRPDPIRWNEAVELCLVGLFKKVAIADPLLGVLVEDLGASGAGLWTRSFTFMAMLVAGYADVTGYIDIARGSAKFLGIDLPRNSLYPLTRSSSYADFWRRWQLTLMMWFRDYVYRLIRGEHRSRDHLALFCTFVALGLWHGVSLGWILWGVASGIIITTERILQSRRAARRRRRTIEARRAGRRSLLPRPPNHAVRLTISLALVIATFPLAAGTDLTQIIDFYAGFGRIDRTVPTSEAVILALLGLGSVLLLDRREERREARAGGPDPAGIARAVAFGVMVTAVIVMSGPAARTFVYQNF